jgi:hypothetical protein
MKRASLKGALFAFDYNYGDYLELCDRIIKNRGYDS